MSRLSLRDVVVLVACLSLFGLGYPVGASAGFIGTGQYLAAHDRQQRVERVQLALQQDRLSKQLAALGVDPNMAEQRVASLTDADLIALDERLEELPAGGAVLELILVAFLVMLILDLTGLTNIFPGIGPGKVR